jgi:hypothetical protein
MRPIAAITSAAAALLLASVATASANDVSRDLRDIRRDEAQLRRERADRNYDLRREFRAIEHGNLRAAEYWDARRRHEQLEINAIKRDLRRDRADLRRDLRGY